MFAFFYQTSWPIEFLFIAEQPSCQCHGHRYLKVGSFRQMANSGHRHSKICPVFLVTTTTNHPWLAGLKSQYNGLGPVTRQRSANKCLTCIPKSNKGFTVHVFIDTMYLCIPAQLVFPCTNDLKQYSIGVTGVM
jgi:hypothetical protein